VGRPPFTRVIPAETERYGPAAAIVLAHIRFRCGSDGPGRYECEGSRWWRVSYGDLGREIGLSASQVERAMGKLANSVVVEHHPPLEDQTRSYRPACDLPESDIGPVVTSQNTKSGGTGPISGGTGPKSGGYRPEIGICTTYGDHGELGDPGEGASSRNRGTALGPSELLQLFSNGQFSPPPSPQPEVVEAEIVSDDDDPGKCPVCGWELDPDGSCPTCRRCQPVVDGPRCSTEGCTGRAEKDGLCGRCWALSGKWRRRSS
jgi:hypothetical protein